MTVLSISQETLIQLPAGSTGGAVKITYNGTTVGQVIGSGDDQGRAVIVSGRLAKLTGLDGHSPLKVVGREAGGRMPAHLTLRIYPEYPVGVDGPPTPITLSGLPVGSPDTPGIWDMSNINDASGGMDVVTAAERQSLALLKERAGQQADRAEAAATSASTAKAQADTAVANLNGTVQGAAAAATAAAEGRINAGLADIAQTQTNLTGAVNSGLAAVDVAVNDFRSINGAYSIGRAPSADPAITGGAPDPAGVYKVATPDGTVEISWDGTKETGRTTLNARASTTETVINAGYFGLLGYPNDDTVRFRAAMTTAVTLGIRRLYIPAAPATAYDPNATSGPIAPHYICGSDALEALANFEIYGDPGGKTIIKNLVDTQRCIIGGQAGPGAQIPGFRLRDIVLWGRADEHNEEYSAQYEHSHLLDLNGYDDAEITRVTTNAPVGDGIYLGGGRGELDRVRNTDVRLIDCGGDGRNFFNRNWISVIDIDGLLLSRPWTRRFSANASGYRAPGSIDMEPNHIWETIRNVYMHDLDLESDGGPGVVSLNLKYHPDAFERRPYNIKMERGRIRGYGKGGGRAENGVFAGGALLPKTTGSTDKLSNLIRASGLDIAHVVRPFTVMGVGDFAIQGTASDYLAAALIGFEREISHVSGAEIDIDFGPFDDAPVALYRASDARIGGSVADAPRFVLAPSGASQRVTIAPRSLKGVNIPIEFSESHTTTPNLNTIIMPPTTTAAQHSANARGIGGSPVIMSSGLGVGTPASAPPSAYPFGMSNTVINGGAGWPSGLGVANTVIAPGFGSQPGGLGFCYQIFVDRGGAGAWIRTAANPDDPLTDWGGFRRLDNPAPINTTLGTVAEVGEVLSGLNELKYILQAQGIVKITL